MYKFAIGYYTMEGTTRKPQSGLDIRLLRPGQSWAEGKKLIETVPDSGYYEIGIQNEADCGFYEIWDNLGNPLGQFSGKTCSIGKMDARGIQNNSIFANHILDGAVTGSKIANAAIGTEHLQDGLLSLTKLQYEIQDQDKGIGDNSQASPAKLAEDKIITHILDKEYQELPHIILTNQCDAFLYIADIMIEGNLVTVLIGISQVYTATDPFYKLLALAK
ncbi:MAG: hypothetical protein LHW45_09315 [Candidatus Cloacimonetes bacterium]|nr:hypothetical protein [Candidatus Cloacimonadota bacterium]MDY0367809.1 hypothetical protein [Candidatus Syntrophosphaera sp.]